jgi:hypothetical protein
MYFLIFFMYSLTQKHDGIYLAQVTAACLRRFGLENFVCCCPCLLAIYLVYCLVYSYFPYVWIMRAIAMAWLNIFQHCSLCLKACCGEHDASLTLSTF